MRLLRYGADLSDEQLRLAWFNRVADRCCFDILRKRRRSPIPETGAEPVDHASNVDARVAEREHAMQLLSRLDRTAQHVAVHYFIDELDQTEIADRLGVSRRTVHTKLKLIRERATHIGPSEGATP